MKAQLMLLLAACSGDNSAVRSKVFPLQITRLAPTTDPATGAVDVSVAVPNTDGYTLRCALVTIAGYDTQGARTGADFPLQIDGPLSAKDNSGVVVASRRSKSRRSALDSWISGTRPLYWSLSRLGGHQALVPPIFMVRGHPKGMMGFNRAAGRLNAAPA